MAILLWLLSTLLGFVLYLGALFGFTLTVDGDSAAFTCYEDQPCWDCSTMGNKICGPERAE